MCEACIFLKRVKRDGKGARRAMDVFVFLGWPYSKCFALLGVVSDMFRMVLAEKSRIKHLKGS